MSRARTAYSALIVAACVAFGSQAAAEEGSPDERAKSLFDAGKKLFDDGRYDDACRSFEESAKLRRGIGVQFQLASCWERIGRNASARALFLDVADTTRGLGQLERERVARERARALESRLSYLSLVVRSPEPGLEIQRDGLVVDRPEWSARVALDAGEHEIRAVAPGKRAHFAKITVRADEPGTVLVKIPPLAAAAAAVVVAPPAPAPELDSTPAAAEPKGPDFTRRNVTIALAGVGTAALLAGTAFSVQAVGNHSDAEAICRSGRCTARQLAQREPLDDASRSARTWAIVGAGVGFGALIGAGYLYLTGPRQAAGHANEVAIEPLASPSEGIFGAVVRGSL